MTITANTPSAAPFTEEELKTIMSREDAAEMLNAGEPLSDWFTPGATDETRKSAEEWAGAINTDGWSPAQQAQVAQHLLDAMVAMKADDLQAVTAKIDDIVGYECRQVSDLQLTNTTATVLLEGNEELGPEARTEMVEDIESWLQVYHFPRLEVEIQSTQG